MKLTGKFKTDFNSAFRNMFFRTGFEDFKDYERHYYLKLFLDSKEFKVTEFYQPYNEKWGCTVHDPLNNETITIDFETRHAAEYGGIVEAIELYNRKHNDIKLNRFICFNKLHGRTSESCIIQCELCRPKNI